jgi:hypothetical protein
VTEDLTVWHRLLGRSESRQALGVDGNANASWEALLSFDQAGFFEGEHHLVDGGSGDVEVAPHVGFRRRSAVDAGVSPDEGEILALPVGEGRVACRLGLVKELIHFPILLGLRPELVPVDRTVWRQK